MFLKTDGCNGVQFEDRDNFRAFKLVVEARRDAIDEVRRALSQVADLEDENTAWVAMAALRDRPEVAHDTTWQRGFAAMIEKARPHGWIDDQRQAIKAHVEWLA